jgi:transketolase
MAEKLLAAEFNRPGHEIVDHRTYVFLGDGCLMEGISHEVLRAGRHLGPGQADGLLGRQRHFHRRPCRGLVHRRHAQALRSLWLAGDCRCGWPRCRGDRGRAQAGPGRQQPADADLLQDRDRPRFAEQGRHPRCAWRAAGRCRDRRRARPHGLEPWPLRDSRRGICRLGCQGQRCRCEGDWNAKFAAYAKAFPAEAAEFKRRMAGELPAGWAAHAAKAVEAPTPRPKPWPRARPRRSPSTPWPRRCPNSLAARPT